MMLRKIWLMAAQGFVLAAAVLYLVDVFGPKPAPLPAAQAVTVKEAGELPTPLLPFSFRGAAGKAVPAIVNIYTAKTLRREMSQGERLLRRFYGLPDESEERGTSLGSGVIVSQDGFVLTNNRVIEGADEIAVAALDVPTRKHDMDWLAANWISVVLIAACVGMHFFGHGGHGGHGAGGGNKPKERAPEDRGSGAVSGHQH